MNDEAFDTAQSENRIPNQEAPRRCASVPRAPKHKGFRRLFSLLGWLILRLGVAGSGRAYGPLSFWFVWQWITNRYYRSKPVRADGFLKYGVGVYRGKRVELSDGTVVERGDRIVGLHFNNSAFSTRLPKGPEAGLTSGTWFLMKEVVTDLAVLAKPGKLGPEIKALHGILLLAPGGKRLGFDTRPMPRTRWNDLTRFFMLGLLAIYSPYGRERLVLAERDSYPGEVWMSRRTLVERYGKSNGHPPEP